jgi:hypothetical protein
MFGRQAKLPIELDLTSSLEPEVETECQMDTYIDTLIDIRDNVFKVASRNIKAAQEKQKRDYDRRNLVVKMANQALLVVLLVSQTLSKTGCILLTHLPTSCTQIVHALCKHPSHFVFRSQAFPKALKSKSAAEVVNFIFDTVTVALLVVWIPS